MNYRKSLLVGAVSFGLVACESLPVEAGAITEKAAQANDKALQAAVFTICYGASVGSVRRMFGDEAGRKIWGELCNRADKFNP